MKLLTRSIAFFAFITLASTLSHAQANKYKRPERKAAPAPAAGTAAPAKNATATAPAAEKKSEKVDIQKIEQEYWQQKDTEFHVVQSRRFTKEKKSFAHLSYGILLNDTFNKGGAISVSGGYFYKEQMGFEISYTSFDAENSKVVDEMLSLGGGPKYARPISQYGATWNWMPIYGKVSVFDKTIIYFDMGVSLGLGIAEYERVLHDGAPVTPPTMPGMRTEKDSSLMFIVDVSQQFFLSDKWALRFDLKNRFYKRDLKKFNNASETSSDNEHTVEGAFGFIYYFK